MGKWILGAIFLAAMALAGYVYYDYKLAGYDTLPELRDGEWFMSFKSGLRVIMVDIPDRQPDRVYSGVALDVDKWLEPVWSYCRPPDAAELEAAPDIGVGQKLEGVCEIDVDGETVTRGLIYSRPNL